jgi:type VI secretion system secreted protein VgrG
MDGSVGYTQTNRQLRIQTPLGEDVLLLESFDGSEQLSSCFAFSLRVRAFNDAIDPSLLITKPVDWQIRMDQDDWRHFNGLVGNYSGGEAMSRGQRSYTLMVVPWLWFLQYRQDSRIFQNKTVVQIATQIFDELGFRDYDTSGLAQVYKPHLYCVQYRETDFNLVSRLFEEEGIFYWFKHEQGRHTLMLADGCHAYKDLPDGSLPYNPPGIFKNSVTSWTHHRAFRAGKATTKDYDFQNPGNSLLSSTSGINPVPQASQFEIFDFPGRYLHRERGEGVSKRLIAGHEKGQDTISSASRAKTLTAGGRFTLEAHPVTEENIKYVVVSTVHHATDPSFESVGKGAPKYQNSFTCMPANVDFVPEQRTEKPVVPGLQSAVVTGPAGEEIYTDRYGRVKVQFHWDRKGKSDENSSCWLRVAQPWAGKGFGAQTIPRIGMEVLVGFMEGDPDQPLVVGSMPNATTIPPINLPDEKERTAFRSATSPGGGGFNEFTMEDKKGREEMFFHAQKDLSEMVGNNRLSTVGNVSAQSTETMWLSRVHDSVIEQTQQHILIKHLDSQIYLDGSCVRINFGPGHVLTLDANGIHLHSAVRVDASQGGPDSGDNYVSVNGSGVDTHGQAVVMTAGGAANGGGAARIEMAEGGIAQTGDKIWLNS